jgi:hypothetical protein
MQVANPRVTATLAHVVLADHHLYVSIPGEAPQIIDVADPDRPRLIGPIGHAPATVWAANTHYAYVTEYPTFPQGQHGPSVGGGLDVVDVSDPPNPVVVGFLETGARPVGSILIDTTFYTSEVENLRIIDVGNPTQPALIGVIPLTGIALAAQGQIAVMSSPGNLRTPNGFHVLDLSDPATPVAIAFPRILSGGYHVALDGTYAYVATLAGFFTVDLSDPHQARQTGVYGPDDSWGGPAIDGTIGYVPWESGDFNHPEWGLRVLDLTDPTQPRDVGFAPTAGIPHQAAVLGHYLYVVQSRTPLPSDNGLSVFDVSDPILPRPIGRVEMLEGSENLAVQGHYVYLTYQPQASAHGYGMRIYDVSDPTHLDLVSDFQTRGIPQQIVVSGDRAYVANVLFTPGIQVLNVSDPHQPMELGFVPSGASGLAVEGMNVFTSDAHALNVYDVSDPASPSAIGTYAGIAGRDIAVDGRTVAVVTIGEGLGVTQFTGS